MAKDDNRNAAGLRRSAVAERLRIREEWSALKEIERNTLNEMPVQSNTNMKQQPVTNFVIRYPKTTSKSRVTYKKSTPKSKQLLSFSEALRGLVMHVDVGSVSKALALRAALMALGATVAPVWSNLVTHLVWSEGGCRQVRSRARLLACKLVSPLWVEACAAAGRRLPEGVFPAASRPSDLPSPNTLKQILKRVEQENITLNLLTQSQESDNNKASRLRISSDTNASHDTSGDKTKDTFKNINEPDIHTRINTAPRRALPISISPERPIKSKRKLFTQKEAAIQTQPDNRTDEDQTPARPKPVQNRKITPKNKQLNRDLVLKFMGTTKTNNQNLRTTQNSDKRPRIVLTGMSRQERQEIFKAIKHLNGRIQSKVNRRTTHILLGTCGSYRTDKIYYCTKCDSIDKILSQMFETNLAVQDSNKRKENVTCKCITLLKKNDKNGQYNDLNTSLLDQDKEPQDVCNATEIVNNDKPRTLNSLLGAVRGCRILYSKWALDSLKVHRWVHPFGYEVAHLKKISDKARFERSALQKIHSEYTYNIFSGTKIKISQDAEQKDAVTQLLTVCGAEIQNDRLDGGTDTGITIGRESGSICSKWVFDSIAAGRMRTTRRYIHRNTPIEVLDSNQ